MGDPVEDTPRQGLAVAATQQGRTLALGFTASLDLVLPVDAALRHRMARWRASAAEEAPVWRTILAALEGCAATGAGAELVLEPAAALGRFDPFGAAMSFGGTAVRAACAAARLGQRTLVSIPAIDPRLASLLGAAGAGSIALRASVEAPPRLPTHYILELGGGAATARDGEGPRAPAGATRLILRGEETWLSLFPDAFLEQMAAAAPPVRILLCSGLNTYTRLPELMGALAHAADWLGRLRRCLPAVWVFLELAGFADPAFLRRALDAVGPLVDAVGMNEDECAAALGGSEAAPLSPTAAVRALIRRFALRRLLLHTARFGLYAAPTALTDAERHAAQRALALGHAAAGFRYAHGYDGTLADLERARRAWTVAPDGLELARRAEGAQDLVAVPAWRLGAGVGSIGLGDAFTGAFLTGLDPPPVDHPGLCAGATPPGPRPSRAPPFVVHGTGARRVPGTRSAGGGCRAVPGQRAVHAAGQRRG